MKGGLLVLLLGLGLSITPSGNFLPTPLPAISALKCKEVCKQAVPCQCIKIGNDFNVATYLL